MPDIQATMFFTARCGTRFAGWSESHYVLGGGSLPTAISWLQELAQDRSALLGANSWLTYLRVSDRLVFRDSQVGGTDRAPIPVSPPLPQPPVAMAGTAVLAISPVPVHLMGDTIYDNRLTAEATSTGDPSGLRVDKPESALAIRAEGGTTFQSRRTIYIRGMPDYIVQSGSDLPRSGRWATNYERYCTTLRGGRWGFRALDMSNANPAMAISRIDTTLPSPLITIVPPPAPAAPPAVGDEVRISGTKMFTTTGSAWNLNGRWVVLRVGADNQYTFKDMLAVGLNSTVIGLGTVRSRKYSVLRYTGTYARRWSSKKVGLPFDPFHGRQRAR